MSPPEGLSYATGATLDCSTVVVLIPFEAARVLCQREGLRLERVEGTPGAAHPLLIEFWRVRDGRAESGGRDQHAWSEGAASAGMALASAGLGAAVGASLGAWLGPVGSWWGAGAGWLNGAKMGQSTGASWGRQVSERVSATLGTYAEIALTLPGAHLPDGRGPFQRVLGMYTDSAVALWTASTFGYGFGKRLCTLEAEAFRSWAVEEGGRTVLEARFDARPLRLTGRDRVSLRALRAWRALPFLGSPSPRRFSVSVMDRIADGVDTISGGVVTVHRGCFAPLPVGRHVPAAVIHTPNVNVRLTRASLALAV